jgi:hypothetical protein
MATREGARTLDRDDIGRLAPGCAADIVLIDLGQLCYAGGLHDPLACVLFVGDTGQIDTTIVAARVLVTVGDLWKVIRAGWHPRRIRRQPPWCAGRALASGKTSAAKLTGSLHSEGCTVFVEHSRRWSSYLSRVATEIGMQINIPDVLAELTAAFEEYQRALLANETDVVIRLFWRDLRALRYGVAENLYGFDEIVAYRKKRSAQGGAPHRTTTRSVITTYGRDFGTTNIEYVRTSSGKAGRQSQTWMRTPDGWRIVAAHVSLLAESDR